MNTSIKRLFTRLCTPLLAVLILTFPTQAQDAATIPDSLAAGDTSVTVTPVDSSFFRADTLEPGTRANTIASEDTTVAAASGSTKPKAIDSLDNLFSLEKLLLSIIVLIAGYFLNRFLKAVLTNFAERFPSQRLLLKGLVPAFQFSIWLVMLYIIIAGIIAPSLESILTLMASVGIAIGFASQDLLKNIFGGLIILLDRPFQVGDKIQVGSHYGEVLSIGLRSTRIETPDDSVVTIPNSELMNTSVSNTNSSALDCQVVAEMYLPINIDLPKMKQIARMAAATSPYAFLNKPIAVIAKQVIEGDQNVLKLRLKAYVLDIRFEFVFMSDMTERLLTELKKHRMLPAGYVSMTAHSVQSED